MADRIAREFQEGWQGNLGVGIPTLCSNTDLGGTEITYHAENGVIGYGPLLPAREEDAHLVNAGGPNVSLAPGGAVGRATGLTCHNGINKPLYGFSMAKEYPELSVPNP